MAKTFAILGAGMQGTAAAYDLAKFAQAERIWLADVDLVQAEKASERVNRLASTGVCHAAQVDALDADGLREFLQDVDVVLSCVPYWMHPRIAKVAIEAKTSMVDLGGNTDITHLTLAMDADAKAAGVTLVPDTGLAPGLVNSLGLWCIEHLDTVDSVQLYCGVLPQNPKPPFNYKVTFNVEGLVTEYDYEAVVLRNGEIVKVETLTEVESLEVEPLGKMEAFVTSGGTSTAPYTLQGKVPNYEYKTIRFPGHCERMRLYKDFGLWREDTVKVPGGEVRPKDVFNAVFGPALAQFVDKDMCAVRAVGTGTKGGQKVQLQIDIFDKEDDATGFTSMERLTGFSMAIYAIEIANGGMPAGTIRYENGMTGTKFCEEIQRRGVELKFNERVLATA